MLQNQVLQPKVIVIRRRLNQEYGFTLRHFIAYPPDTSDSYQRRAMETIFIKEVHPNGPAHLAGLQTGDRVLMVNSSAVAGISYSTIVSMIKQTPTVLRLQVVPKECDVLQMYYTDIAHTPETNRQTDIIRPQIPITATNNFHLNQRMISYSPEGVGTSNISYGQQQIKQTTTFNNSNSNSSNNGSYDSPRIMIDGCQLRPKPSNISVLQKPNNNDEFMIRLRKSIEQKEEFLKSPIPHSQTTFMYHNQDQQQIRYPIKNSNLTSLLKTPQQNQNCVNNIVKQTNDLAVTTIGGINNTRYNNSSNNSNASKFINKRNNFPMIQSSSSSSSIPSSTKFIATEYTDNILKNPYIIRDTITRKQQQQQQHQQQQQQNNSIVNSNNGYISSSNISNNSCALITTSNTGNSSIINSSNNSNTIKEKFHKELEFLESLPEMGVTNQVFERKLVSNLAKGFDPFKPLSINTGSNNTTNNSGNEISNCTGNNIYRKTISAAEFELIDFHNKTTTNFQSDYKNESSPENIESDEFISMQYQSKEDSDDVMRRDKSTIIDDTKPMRRISYLRANNNELNELETESVGTTVTATTPTTGDGLDKYESASSSSATVQNESRKSESLEKETETVNEKIEIKEESPIFETEMEIKSSCIYGKRISEYRSWRQAKIELNGNTLKISPVRSSKSDNNVIEFNVKNFNIVDETIDKKKFVFKLHSKPRINNDLEISMAVEGVKDIDTHLTTSLTINSSQDKNICEEQNTEVLFKTKSITEMKKLFGLLQEICESQNNSQLKQMAEPQRKAATASVSTNSYCDENTLTKSTNVQIQITKEYSPILSSKNSNESDTQLAQPIFKSNSMTTSTTSATIEPISPLMKTRKSSQQKIVNDKDLGSPKTKNWKDMLFRRIHGNSGSGGGGSGGGASDHVSSSSSSSSPSSATVRPIGSIGVPLKLCPMSKDNEFVPIIVEVCTNVVETKGLSVVGIYRIPGNKAAISELKEQVNKIDFAWDKIDSDVKWDDVNVVSSLLKLFIRTLPDALLPSTFYINFIEADKKTGEQRLRELKNLLNDLPEHSYQTMKHIIRHLMRVSKNCEVNLMEPKNLAIIFGPSIIRSPNETLESAVKDMKHQCRIVELLLTQYDYFFENGEFPELEPGSPSIIHSSSASHHDQTTLLLDNVSKIEQKLHDKESITSRFIPHLRRRTHSKRSAISSDTYSGESVLSLEYKKYPDETQKENANRSISKKHENVEISISLTDEDSSNSRISDTGSMSLTTITDTLDTKLRNLRSEAMPDTVDGLNKSFNRSNSIQKPLVLHENIPYADESPERHIASQLIDVGGMQSTSSTAIANNKNSIKNYKNQQQYIRDITKNIASINSRFSSTHDSSCSDDDSEVSTTSDPKESILISPLFPERYKKRRDYRLFRSASFNCRNYSSRNHNNVISSSSNYGSTVSAGYGGSDKTITNLTKDEKTDMNLTKKRQIQNKQNRSIKRRHTVGGPHDYSTTAMISGQHHHRRHNNNNNNNNISGQHHEIEVGIRIKNVNRRN